MNKIVGRDFEKWRRGDKIKPPENPTEWDELIINFFLSIHKIISKENHILKFDGCRQVVDVLNDAARAENINLEFYEEKGEWGLRDTGYSINDLLRLRRLQFRFSRIWRHHAGDYSYGDRGSYNDLLEMLSHGRKNYKED